MRRFDHSLVFAFWSQPEFSLVKKGVPPQQLAQQVASQRRLSEGWGCGLIIWPPHDPYKSNQTVDQDVYFFGCKKMLRCYSDLFQIWFFLRSVNHSGFGSKWQIRSKSYIPRNRTVLAPGLAAPKRTTAKPPIRVSHSPKTLRSITRYNNFFLSLHFEFLILLHSIYIYNMLYDFPSILFSSCLNILRYLIFQRVARNLSKNREESKRTKSVENLQP